MKIIFLFILLTISSLSSAQTIINKDYLVLFTDTTKDEYGYKNLKGDTMISLGKYDYCFTDTFRTFAIVLSQNRFIVIDREENTLYEVFPFDNGPDYSSEGLFRIIINYKIGYADSSTGNIIISPQYDCAYSFENGTAEVSNDCKQLPDGEHKIWVSNNWYYI
ncbi:MAG: WG repeat-containing protein, partial [Ignavibacteria bacterium]|nr:WG repeat-containing protein [Ignavibacteria bacterium]